MRYLSYLVVTVLSFAVVIAFAGCESNENKNVTNEVASAEEQNAEAGDTQVQSPSNMTIIDDNTIYVPDGYSVRTGTEDFEEDSDQIWLTPTTTDPNYDYFWVQVDPDDADEQLEEFEEKKDSEEISLTTENGLEWTGYTYRKEIKAGDEDEKQSGALEEDDDADLDETPSSVRYILLEGSYKDTTWLVTIVGHELNDEIVSNVLGSLA